MTIFSNRSTQAKSSDEFTVEPLPNGTLRVVYVTKRRVVYFWRVMAAGIVLLCTSTVLAGGGGSYPVEGTGFQWHKVFASVHNPSRWTLTAFMLCAIFLIGSAFSGLTAWQEFLVSRDLIIVNYYHSRLRFMRRRYTFGQINVERQESHDSQSKNVDGYRWFLRVNPNRMKGILAFSMAERERNGDDFIRTDSEYARIAELVSLHTGWELASLPDPLMAEPKTPV